MNITLREVYQTNTEGDRFWKLKECYIRGSTVRPFIILDVVCPLIWTLRSNICAYQTVYSTPLKKNKIEREKQGVMQEGHMSVGEAVG